jgi:hypothetical protein
MLAFSTIDDIGYLLLGLAAGTTGGALGALIGALSHSLCKFLLFGAVGVAEKDLKHHVTLEDRGLSTRHPVAGAAFIAGALGMIGVPPLMGFLGRWRLYFAGVEVGGLHLELAWHWPLLWLCCITSGQFIASGSASQLLKPKKLSKTTSGWNNLHYADHLDDRSLPVSSITARNGREVIHEQYLLTPDTNISQTVSLVYRINAGSCNGCDIEVAPCFSPRYDGEQIGAVLQGSPKHADIY